MIARKKPLPRSAKPIPRKRAKPRTWKSPRCDVQGCQKPQDVKWPVAPGGKEAIWSVGHRATDEVISSVKIVSPIFPSGAEYGVVSTYGSVTSGPWNGMCRSHANAEADRRFSLFIRARDSECRIKTGTPCVGPPQCCHLLSRRFHATRWDESNAVAGCAGHHAYWTRNPDRWAAFLDERQRDFLPDGTTLADLRQQAFHGDPMDVADVLARYPAAKKET